MNSIDKKLEADSPDKLISSIAAENEIDFCVLRIKSRRAIA